MNMGLAFLCISVRVVLDNERPSQFRTDVVINDPSLHPAIKRCGIYQLKHLVQLVLKLFLDEILLEIKFHITSQVLKHWRIIMTNKLNRLVINREKRIKA